MFEFTTYEHARFDEDAEFNKGRHQEILDTLRGCARGHRVKERYTGRYTWPDFDEASYFYKDQITQSLETQAPTDGSAWPAEEIVDALHELKDFSLAKMGTERDLSKPSNYLHRIEQTVWRNLAAFRQFAQHPNEKLATQATSLIGHMYISFYDLRGAAPDALDFALPAIERERTLIHEEHRERRHYTFFRNILLGNNEAHRETLLQKLNAPDVEEAVIKDIQANLMPFSYHGVRDFDAPTIDHLRVMADIRRSQYRSGNLSESEARQVIEDALTLLPNDGSDASSAIKRQILETARELKVGSDYVDSLLGRLYNLDDFVLRKAWQDAVGDEYQQMFWGYRKGNIDRIAELELTHPGSTAYLHRHYRIKNFGRLSLSVLRTQYTQAVAAEHDTRAESDRPLTNRVYIADYDHNTAFIGTLGYIDQLAQYTKKARQRLEIFEVADVSEIIKDIQDSPQLIGSIALCAHSNGSDATLSRTRSLNRAHLMLSRHQPCRRQLSARFALGATGIFNSCHTGKDNSLGEISADFFGIRVFAPDRASGLRSIQETSNTTDPHTPLQLQPEYSKLDAIRQFGA